MTKSYSTDLEKQARSYTYDAQAFVPLRNRLAEKIMAYDVSFGPYLASHLANTAHDTEQFMIHLGYDEDIARKTGHAFAIHDIGKVKQDIALWRLTVDKPTLSAEEKLERIKHTDIGVEALDETIAEMGVALTDDQKAHLDFARCLMLYHHERLNGTGPKAFTGDKMDRILRIVTIVDTVDGKTKAKEPDRIFEDMRGTKHEGEFDDALVAAYEAYYRDKSAKPVLAKPAQSL